MLPKDLFIYFVEFNDISEINKLYKLNKTTVHYFNNTYAKKVFVNAINNKYCESPHNNLLHSILNKDNFLIPYFIENGAANYNKAAQYAVSCNNVQIAYYLIDKICNCYNKTNHYYSDYYLLNSLNNILLCAARYNNIDIAKYTIEKGATWSDVAMSIAAINNNMDMVLFFFNRDTKFNFNDMLRDDFLYSYVDDNDINLFSF